ncbi:hypothetical protein [Dietzia sp. PP-33]|uniref:hypothetical protein n=1 Tax=Dietzia sp. PP-33 TaxID=2957500 RepID=UPI0029B70B6B|nr:hypothetical protein [Dietzia sp. PP-33]MDX2355279.1 hypothetical protein [Dietzia sp. PP-33]
MSTPGSTPLPGPAGPDLAELRSAFDDLLADSIGPTSTDGEGDGDGDGTVRDDQVEALDAAHELLAGALSALDSAR